MTDNQRKEQGERLRRIRKDLGMTQGDFAHVLGADQTQISRTEKGAFAIQTSYLSELAQLGYNLNWLITGTGNMKALESDNGSQASVTSEPNAIHDQQVVKIKEFLKSKFPDFNL